MPLNDHILLEYPQIHLYGVKINIQANIFGVHFYNATPIDARNNTKAIAIGGGGDDENLNEATLPITNLESAEMLALIYKAGRVGDWTPDEIKAYEREIAKYFEQSVFVCRRY